ncbi:MAG: Gfo/Idh/MocA family protein [Christensenellales bacterium]|jgi:predicted dehydrogenase
MLKYGIVGASLDSFIGDVHIRGIEATRKAELVAGCFSRSHEKTLAAAKVYGVTPDRAYSSFSEMAAAEAAREDGIDFVVITTPNNTHYPCAKAFLEQGIHVSCDKPLTVDEEQAKELQALAKKNDLLFCVTYTFAGLPTLRHIRSIIQNGDIGNVLMIMGENAQSWIFEDSSNADISAWRTQPESTGKTNCLADIGTHVEFTAHFLTGLSISAVCCKLDELGPGGQMDTNVRILLEYDNGATGIYWTSQIALGNDNALRLRIYGDKGSVEWKNDEPEVFSLTLKGQPTMRIAKGKDYFASPYSNKGRLPAGHAEGLFYAFANIYDDFITAVQNKKDGKPYEVNFPTVDDGYRGMHFLDSCIQSNKENGWVTL